MSDAAAFQATYHGCREIKSRGIVQFVFEVPTEAADHAHEVLGGFSKNRTGQATWCGIARIVNTDSGSATKAIPKIAHEHITQNTDGTSTKPSPDILASPVRASRQWHEIPYAQQAGILASDTSFWDFLNKKFGIDILNVSDAVGFIRRYCRVESRSDIQPHTEAEGRWNLLVSAFRQRAA